MSIHVRLFASYREAVGKGDVDLSFESGLTAGRVWDRLVEEHQSLAGRPSSAAVNQTMADLDTELLDGDEVAFLPPVGGG